MPASPDRKLVAIRLQRDVVKKLNDLCSVKMRAKGWHVHRSEMIADLIVDAHKALKLPIRRQR